MTDLDLVLFSVYGGLTLIAFTYALNYYLYLWLYLRRRKRALQADRDVIDAFEAEARVDEDWPIVTTQLPIYNEANVVEGLLAAVCAIEYPRSRHEIQVLDDSTDETADLLERLVIEWRARGHDISLVHRIDRTGFKAGALANGLEQARGEFIAIFDADFLPTADFLKRTVPFLLANERTAWVQSRWEHINRDDNALTSALALGLDNHHIIEQTARAWGGLLFNFNGTCGVWRKAAIEDAGGWHADTLTEDTDLSYRAQMRGWHGRFLLEHTTPGEIPASMNALKAQQHRWAKGSIQTAVKLLWRVAWARGISPLAKLQGAIHLTAYAVYPIMLAMTVMSVPVMWRAQPLIIWELAVPYSLVMLAAFLAPTILNVVSQWTVNRTMKRPLVWAGAMIILGCGLAVANTKAVFGGLFGPRGEFVRTPKCGVAPPRLGGVGVSPARMTGQTALEDMGLAAADERARRQLPKVHRKIYRASLQPLFVVEIALGLWLLTAFTVFMLDGRFWIGPFMLLQATGFLIVGIASIVDAVRTQRAARDAAAVPDPIDARTDTDATTSAQVAETAADVPLAVGTSAQ